MKFNRDNEDEIPSNASCYVYAIRNGEMVFYCGYGGPEEWSTVINAAVKMPYRVAKIMAKTYKVEVAQA